MGKREFLPWLQSMKKSINRYDYYVDFKKVCENVENIQIELNILNSLIGSEYIEKDVKSLLERYPEVLKVIPILLAIRQHEILVLDEAEMLEINFNKPNFPIETYIKLMRETGLLNLMQSKKINNLVDYVTGVETGLDSNARKNRGGHQMEDLVESFIKKAKFEYYKELYLPAVEEKWGVDLSLISNEGTSTKRWDFVIKTKNTVYLVETNFYSSGGSKLNEVARSYENIAEKVKHIDGVEFIWVTDGAGWKSARRNLEETFNVMEHIYNIEDMEAGALERLV